MISTLRRTLFAGIVLASIWTATASSAQAQSTATKPDTVSLQEIEKAAEQLADAVQAAVRKATEDPAVKVAALKVAKNAVAAAQVAITIQTQTLQTVLDALAKEIAVATEKQQAKSKTP